MNIDKAILEAKSADAGCVVVLLDCLSNDITINAFVTRKCLYMIWDVLCSGWLIQAYKPLAIVTFKP